MRLIGVALIGALVIAGCSEEPAENLLHKHIAPVPGAAPQVVVLRDRPWQVFRKIPAHAASLIGIDNTTFSLARNLAYNPIAYGYVEALDLRSGEKVFDLRVGAVQKEPPKPATIVVGDSKDISAGLLLGEGEWGLVWTLYWDASNKPRFPRALISTKEPHRIVPLEGALPDLGLLNVVEQDGGFLSIRAEMMRLVNDDGNATFVYETSVYRIKDFKVDRLTAEPSMNPYWKWVGAKIPSAEAIYREFTFAGKPPSGAPTMFSADGRALTETAKGFCEWRIDSQKWEALTPPAGPSERDIVGAFYAGTSLFVQTNTKGVNQLWCRLADDRWADLGELLVMARDGGRHLMVADDKDTFIVEPD